MKSSDIKTIEADLGIKLPKHYVTFLLGFEGFNNPEWEVEHFLYSTPDLIIYWNRMTGFHSTEKFVKNKLIIGESGGGDFYLIDLADPINQTVYFLDHEESVENAYDKKTQKWDWNKVESYENLEAFKNEIIKMWEGD